MDEVFRDGGFAIAPPFIHIGSRAIRTRDINGVSIRSGAENAAMGCLLAIVCLAVAWVAATFGPVGIVIAAIIVLGGLVMCLRAFSGAAGLKTVVLRVGSEDVDAYESSDAQQILRIKTLIEDAMSAS